MKVSDSLLNTTKTFGGNMRFIFLDIDGVLNTYNTLLKYKANPEDPTISYNFLSGMLLLYEVDMAQRLRNLLYLFPETCIIGISSWFTGRRDVKDISKVLEVEITSRVSYTGGGSGRPKAIQEFLDKNPCEAFVILDDQMEGYEPLKANHVEITGCGFNPDKYEEAVRILKGEAK